MASEFDIIIVGGGPAGLSAAASIVRQDHKTVLFDSGTYRNARSSFMHTLSTWDHRSPADYRAAARADLERYGSVTVEDVEIARIEQRGDGLFEASSGQRTWVAKKVILATGVEDVFPDIPGYAESWVSGIFHCLYCHGWEERGAASAGVLAEGDIAAVLPALHLARQALRMAERVTIYTHGNERLAHELEEALKAAPAPMAVDKRTISRIEKKPHGAQIALHFGDQEVTEGFLAHKPASRLRGSLAQQLGLALTPKGGIQVSPPFNQTSVKGVFAGGDCASPMHTVTAALHSGTCTGGGAPLQIQAEQWKQQAIF